MNGPKILKPNGVVLTEEQIRIVDMVKELLALCLEGQVEGVGIVGLKKEGFFSAWGGANAAGINLGLDDLKDRILKAARESADEKLSRRSTILRN